METAGEKNSVFYRIIGWGFPAQETKEAKSVLVFIF